ncbi:related to signal recognition particle 68 kDa protein [Cephalotrichum gorgonifer]|uniref:Signal recognition particle subunit SRP68 n=1 Tax=Cephalotrichum gorgonifer TaxID=2041049 RepID=A0AAE8N4K9_9PEZI|nr:related to signal recognition particle 68 kDa protein [Cephalotrichum gorgonifer]
MDITKFVVSGRAQTFGDNAAYRGQLSRRLQKCRRRLGIATKPRGKFQKRDDISPEQIKEKPEYAHVLLLTSERAWAHGMSMRAVHMADAKGITGRNRSHIISRIDKAARTAESLVAALADTDESGATTTDLLEAYAYAGLMRGAANFEKQSWDQCLKNYAVSRAIYSALTTNSSNGETFKDLLSETIDPSIQYAAYQLKTPRTVPVHIIARKAFPSSNTFLVDEINKLDPTVLRQGDQEAKKELAAPEDVPKDITWRGRKVPLEDAAIAQAWGRTQTALSNLGEKLASTSGMLPKEVASSYDDILAASQDAVDATKQAIDELRGENVPQTDPRMQSLQITRTAVNYEMISWRIGRNRVLTGKHDGAPEDYSEVSKRELKKAKEPSGTRDEKPRRKLAKLRERVALYDGALQNVQEAKVLPGIPADEELSEQLDATEKYFTALKSLSIARSHALSENNINALALLHHAQTLAKAAAQVFSANPQPPSNSPLNIQISNDSARLLESLLDREVQRYRALVHLQNTGAGAGESDVHPSVPLIDRLSEYPRGGVVDLENIIHYPPKPTFVPVKPIFLDVAWNYIEYPGRRTKESERNREERDDGAKEAAAPAQQKRGWFGFGRS